MKFAYTKALGRGDVDLVLARLADRLFEKGWQARGVVQINTECDKEHACDMDVKVLPDGPLIRISQSLGREARGCRLNADALEQAVMEVSKRIDANTDILIINKFGKHEAEGRGFRDLIGDAISRDIAILVGLNELNEQAFLTFAEGLAVEVDSNVEALAEWFEHSQGVPTNEPGAKSPVASLVSQ